MARYAVNDESKIVHRENGRDVNPKNLGNLKMVEDTFADGLRQRGYRGCTNCNPEFDIVAEEEEQIPATSAPRRASGSRRRALESNNEGEEATNTVANEREGQEPEEEGSEEESTNVEVKVEETETEEDEEEDEE